ncbi:Calmodulin-binding protein, putative, expressed [Zostera marina]|uniref:Calmodulin-binding protein, putative, expressed n=1 Tax=Zostera marina TaxID=29655 RepID=A0A0K9P4U3_ZOSMR|nr:Calmodulin-binding protein, putative, expressed [Zostera marina]
MATKRIVDVEEESSDSGSGSGRPVKRQRPIVGPDCPGFEEMTKLQCMDSIPRIIEPFLRKVVREEVDRILSCYRNFLPRTSSVKQIADARRSRRWQLRFRKKLPATVFAGTKLEADDNSVIEVSMIDTFSSAIVTTGDLSAIKIEILVLDGDFGQEDWTQEEFNGNLVHERDGKRPLLAGDLSVLLREGSGVFGDVNFTDNSSWTRSRKFRLGLRAVESSSVVKEAVSGAFMVKDHRGELYKKHHPPALTDDIWRLEKIGKDGVFHRKLVENGISTVQDLLRFLVVNEDKVRSMFGSGMSNRTWETIVQHAWECWIENIPFCYYNLSQLQLYFNSILQPVGVKFHGSYYQPYSDLNLQDQALVNKLKLLAYINQKDIVPIGLLDFPGHH